MTIRRALLSVYDKSGIVEFARELHGLGVELIASGGTARALVDERIPVTPIEEVTGFPELLGHRVVTLHPAVHGGILARRDVPADLAELEAHGIGPIDLVCVNLYPFEKTVGRLDVAWEDAIEQIDIGGPALLRAAAKNHDHVVPLCRPADYGPLLEEFRNRAEVSLETRRDAPAGALDGGRVDVVEDDLVAGRQHDLGDAGTHRPGADEADRRHTGFIASNGWRQSRQ